MELTNRQKTDAVNEAYTKRIKLREHYADLADVGDEDAQRKLEKTNRELDRLKIEARRLEAERSGDPVLEGRAAAEQHTRRIEAEFRQDLARMGHDAGHTPDVRRQIEETALAYVRDHHGEHAAERCRRLLVSPATLPDEEPTDGLDSVPVLP